MRTPLAVIPLIFAALCLAGCTVNVGTPATSRVDAPAKNTATQDPPPVQASIDPNAPDEASYLDFLKQQAPVMYAANSEKDNLALGYFVCTKFRDGASGKDVVQALGQAAQQTGIDTKEILTAAWAATHELCPQYSDRLEHLAG